MRSLSIARMFILLACSMSCMHVMNGQNLADLKVKGYFEQKALNLLFFELGMQYDLKFLYEYEEIKDVKVTVSIGRKRLEDAMRLILNGTRLGFEFREPNLIIVIPKAETEQQIEEVETGPTQFDFTVSGVIKDKFTGETLPFATIIVDGSKNGSSSNVDGYFTLFHVPSDTSILEARYLGYQSRKFRLKPSMNMEELEIELEDFSLDLEEVVILAKNESQMMNASSGISKIGFSPAQMASLPSFGEKDIFRSLQLLPGISGTNESSSGLYVRGGTPDQNLILFDGFTVYHVDHLFGFFSAFNPSAVKDVQLYKGGFGAKYGGRISSVVELTGKDGNTENFNAGFGLSLVSMNAFAEAPFAKGKGSIFVAGRRSFQSGFYNNLFESFTESNQNTQQQGGFPGGRGGPFAQQQTQPNSYFYDLNAKITFRPSKKDVLSLSFFNGEDDLDNSRIVDSNSGFGGRFANANFNFVNNTYDLTNWGNWGSSLKWSRKWSDSFYSNAHISYSNYYSERDRRVENTITRSDTTIDIRRGTYEFNDLRDYSFKLDNEWKLSPNNQLSFGVNATLHDIEYTFTQNDSIDVLDRMDQGWVNSIYISDQHLVGEKIRLEAGIRGSHYSVTQKLYWEPRASLSYSISDKLRLKGAWGQYYQFATRIVREDIQQGSRDFWLLANDDNVPISYSEHFIAGISYETPTFLFDIEAYYKKLEGLSEYTTRFVVEGLGPNRSLNYEEQFFQGDGIARGLEFLAQKKVGDLTGWIGYTLGEVDYQFDVFGDNPFPANQDQTHELKIVLNYKRKRWTFGGTFIYATGRPYTAPTGYYEVRLLDGTTADYFEVSGKNALRLPNYHRADLSATYELRLGNSKADVGISFFNIYNRNNVWYKEYEVIEGELIETDVSLLNFTPSLFFNWTLR